VSVDNFVRAETDRMFAALQADAGGVNVFRHNRAPTSIEGQTVIRMNRDTLYSFAIVDISEGATVTVPDGGDRYLSVMVVNQDHYINRLFHDPGEYELTVAEFETRWVLVAVRVLVDPVDPADVAAVTAIQDQVELDAHSSKAFEMPDYESSSFDATREAVLELAKHAGGLGHAFGARDEVDPVRHLIATAAGWRGLPDREARYISVDPGGVAGNYKLTVRDVPVDGFWSVSVYNADGFFERNGRDAYSINNITATPNDDGSITTHFGGCGDSRPNCLPITDGWNYIVRLYRPRPEVLDGSWTFPSIEPA
jgi:hypothetical protein